MSELKVYKMVDENYCDDSFCVVPSDVYLKSEANKVIAELQKQVHDYSQGLYEIQSSAEKELRLQKYKRCLNNAWWILREEFFAEDCHDERWVNWAIRWYKRWMELAKQFKEAK